MAERHSPGAVHPGSLIVTAVALMAIGVVMVTSATVPLDRSLFEQMLTRSVFGRQLIFIVLGVFCLVLASRMAVPLLGSPTWRRRLVVLFFVGSMAALMIVLHPGFGAEQRGSQRWLRLGPAWAGLGFQPSEFSKLALVGFLAYWLADRATDVRSFRGAFLPGALAIGLCVGLVGKEDFGTAAIVAGVGMMMMLVAGCRWLYLLLLGALGACGMSALLVIAPYRLARLTAFQDIWRDSRGHGYQPVQSLTTIASGGWLGAGLGAGVQKHGYLPEGHTDFIFSVICEETGVLGGGVVIALYCALVWLGLRTLRVACTPFERLLAFGITAVIGVQAVMNIAVVTVMAPTTGVSLPLISAGGSGILTFCTGIGVLCAIAARATAENNAEESISEVLSSPETRETFGAGSLAW